MAVSFFPSYRPGDLLKTTTRWPAQPFDVGSVVETMRQNWLALSDAQQLWAEGAQAVAFRQGQFWAEMMETVQTLTRVQTDSDAPEDKLADQILILKGCMERLVRHQDEMVETVHQAGRDGRRLVEQRAAKTMTEMKVAIERAKQRRTA